VKLFFTEEDSQRANDEWGANCGPHSLAAAIGCTLDRAHELLPTFDYKRYVNPTMMACALVMADIDYVLSKGLRTPVLCEGLNRIQWEGKWLRPGVPARVAYGYTHWVAHVKGWVFCTCMPIRLWITEQEWRESIAEVCQRNKSDGWHVTHHYAFEVKERNAA
jgi:hypothetical protein